MTRVTNLETGDVEEFADDDTAHTFCAEWCVENDGWEFYIDRDGDYVLMRDAE